MATVVNENPEVYYKDQYWNELSPVNRRLNLLATGHEDLAWWKHFWRNSHQYQPYKRALVLNCGNGWVERELYDAGMLESVLAIDYSPQLLDQAESQKNNRRIEYRRLDVNLLDLGLEQFDLVINHAAGHHVQKIDHVFRTICHHLKEDGVFVCYDYVGPHRYQYSFEHWQRVIRYNETLPEMYRAKLGYPYIPTMLLADPTEAIHSELIVEVFKRYFECEYFASLGGGLAYPILTFNSAFFSSPLSETENLIERILDSDILMTRRGNIPTLFAYFWGRPKKEVLKEGNRLFIWNREEEEREKQAGLNGGIYYPRTLLQELKLLLDKLRSALIKDPYGKITKQNLIDQFRAERDQLRVERDQSRTWVPPGHFYSPIPSIDEVKLKEEEIFNNIPKEIPGVNLNEQEQISLLNKFREYYNEQPFEAHKKDNLRYFFENPNYSYSDAIFLHCFIRHTHPKKIIEIGSGFSSCVILDTNELFFENSISCTFIDPHPELLLSLIKDSDKDRIEIIRKHPQDVEIKIFSELSSGDILFIDSSHVAKVNSDVNNIFFKILPYLKSGVYIHFHDIFYPFEYPREWIFEGRAWNESYLLKAFLQYNNAFEIQFFNTFLEYFHNDRFINEMPLCLKNPGGSIWIKKI